MDFYEAVRSRRSVRNYLPAAIPQDKLDRIWEALRWAPSACNLQPWLFLLVKSPAKRELLKKAVRQDWAFTAPWVIVGLGNRAATWQRDGQSIHEVDVSIATEHLVLAAATEGLGTCWICAFDRKAVHKALSLSSEWDPVVITPLGFPDDPSPRTDRKPLEMTLREI
jgi:nitroreductase